MGGGIEGINITQFINPIVYLQIAPGWVMFKTLLIERIVQSWFEPLA